MNTIKMTVLLAPLCGHQEFHEDCYMCVNLHKQTRVLLRKVTELSAETNKGVAVTLEAYEDTSGDTSTRKGRK
jgi:hypothetical protein